MTTARETVYRALSYNLNRQSEAEIEPDELEDGIAVLNDMMTSLEDNGVFLGYTYITDGSQEVTIPSGAFLGVTQNLGIQLAPMFGGKVSPLLLRNAEKSWQSVLSLGIQPPKMAYPSNLPRGTGRYWWNQTYNTFFDGKIIPEVEISFSNNGTITPISAVDTPVAISGTWVKIKAKEFTTTDAGLITYTGRETRVFTINSRFTSTISDKHINFYVYLNGIQSVPSRASAYIETTSVVPLYFKIVLRKNDTVQFFVENIDDDTDILVSDAFAELR